MRIAMRKSVVHPWNPVVQIRPSSGAPAAQMILEILPITVQKNYRAKSARFVSLKKLLKQIKDGWCAWNVHLPAMALKALSTAERRTTT